MNRREQESAHSVETTMELETSKAQFAEALAREDEEERVQQIAQTCREYEDLLASYKARAAAGERAEEQTAFEWANRHQPNPHGIARIGWKQPAQLRQGLRTELGRAMRHWETPEGTLLLTVRLAEGRLLPTLSGMDAEERERVNAFLTGALGLTDAVSEGRLLGFVVCWQQTGRWPRRPVSIRLLWPGGKAQGEKVVGSYGPLLERMVQEAGQRPIRHMTGDRQIGMSSVPPRH